jgi:hypothetical protein
MMRCYLDFARNCQRDARRSTLADVREGSHYQVTRFRGLGTLTHSPRSCHYSTNVNGDRARMNKACNLSAGANASTNGASERLHAADSFMTLFQCYLPQKSKKVHKKFTFCADNVIVNHIRSSLLTI